jgi:hypothetical protein
MLEISPLKSRLNQKFIETFDVNTMIRGRIRESMELGVVTKQRKGSEAGIENRTATHNDELQKVFFLNRLPIN